jgi:hypothetical protein
MHKVRTQKRLDNWKGSLVSIKFFSIFFKGILYRLCKMLALDTLPIDILAEVS